MLIAGERHIDDLREIAEDKALREAVGIKEIPSCSAVGDWIRRGGNTEGIRGVKKVIYETNRKALKIHETAEEVVWEYNKRAQMENIIKELKNGIGMESLPSGEFGGNAMWFSLGVLSYNIFILKRELILPDEYKTRTIDTIRWLFIEIGGKLVKHGRKLWLYLSTTAEKFNLLLHIRKKIMAFV